MTRTIDDKLDSLLVHTTELGVRQDAMLARMDKVEASAAKMEGFVDKCTLGRRVLLWGLSALGTTAALAIAAYSALRS